MTLFQDSLIKKTSIYLKYFNYTVNVFTVTFFFHFNVSLVNNKKCKSIMIKNILVLWTQIKLSLYSWLLPHLLMVLFVVVVIVFVHSNKHTFQNGQCVRLRALFCWWHLIFKPVLKLKIIVAWLNTISLPLAVSASQRKPCRPEIWI